MNKKKDDNERDAIRSKNFKYFNSLNACEFDV